MDSILALRDYKSSSPTPYLTSSAFKKLTSKLHTNPISKTTKVTTISGLHACELVAEFHDPRTAPTISWHTLDSLYDSNHYPIVISDKTPTSINSVQKWKIAHADWDNYSSYIKSQTDNLQLSDNIDEATQQFINCIISAAEKYVGKHEIKFSNKVVPWWSEACKVAVKECKTALNRYRRTRTQEDLINFKKLKAKSKRILKESKKQSWNKFVSTITSETPPRQVWTKIKQMQGQNTIRKIPALIDNNKTVTSSQEIVRILADHFQAKSKNENIPQSLHTRRPIALPNSDSLNLPFTHQELIYALSSCKNSAAGPDDIPFNPLAQNIQETCHALASQNISVSILWVPSHVGIIGNERADQAAKEALNSDLTVKEVQLYKDLKNTLKQITTNKWQNLWNQSNTKLQSIQPTINVNNLPPMNRRDKIKIRRLRIGHTRATHGYIMESGNPTLCEHCNCQLSVKHFLSECPQYNVARQRHNITGDTKEDLNPSSNLNNIINYLKDIKLYSYI
ncbi:hypothetical protein NQ318_018347 [Aromia moschata]|uniref:RNase H type-1 domain-containing protein n=1 Tax=Aromia moschata TaxID=1265417 RepID=A0AAV8ZFP7_9CUCU|nr:hypothetical protein NQ318_018347 [Aromia moschata]